MFEQVSQGVQGIKGQSSQMMERISTQMHQTVGRGVTGAVTESFQSWLNAHPTIDWTVNHPLWALGLVLLSVFLFWGLLRAIAQFIEQIWIAILRLPLRLIQWIVGLGKGTYQRLTTDTREIPAASETNSEQRLTELLTQLEALQQEEANLLQEIKTLLTAEPNS